MASGTAGDHTHTAGPALMRLMAQHLALSGLAAGTLALWFGLSVQSVVGHVVVVALGQLSVLVLLGTLRATGDTAWRALVVALPFALLAGQSLLYLMHAFSYTFWGRSITLQILIAYLPGVLDGTEPLPLTPTALLVAIAAAGIAHLVLVPVWAPALSGFLEHGFARLSGPARPALAVLTLSVWTLAASVTAVGATSTSPVWYSAPLISFIRGNPVIFEPTPRRRLVAAEDTRVRAAYPRAAAPADAPHVILIVVDSLRADHTSAYGYAEETTPFLDSLIDNGARRVDRFMATCPESYCGITSLLTSRPFRDVTQQNFKLQEALALRGYTPIFLLSGLHTSWYNMGAFYGGEPHHVVDGTAGNGFSLSDDRQVLHWLDRMPASGDDPAFMYIHLMSAHEAGFLQPKFQGRLGTRVADLARPLLQRVTRRIYDNRVRQADEIIAGIFARLDRLGYLDRAVVMITSDHGEGLGGRHLGHGFELFDEALRVPLIIHDPADVTYRNLEHATHVDVAPTIVDRLGLPVPESWAGRSLLADPVDRMTVHQTYFAPERYAVVYRTGQQTWKYLATPSLGREHLFDLEADPREQRDVISAADPVLVAQLRARLAAYLNGTDETSAMTDPH